MQIPVAHATQNLLIHQLNRLSFYISLFNIKKDETSEVPMSLRISIQHDKYSPTRFRNKGKLNHLFEPPLAKLYRKQY